MPTLKAGACVNYLNDWYRLNQQEKNYLLMNPWHLLAIKESANKALNEAQSKFGAGSLHNGAGDAFRHCYWSALLARDIGARMLLLHLLRHTKKNPDYLKRRLKWICSITELESKSVDNPCVRVTLSLLQSV
jgi:hypothetical protein